MNSPGRAFPVSEKKITPSPFSQIRLLIILIVGIFFAEVLAMIAIYYIDPQQYWVETVVDASIMTVLIIPILYFFHFRPLFIQITERDRSESLFRKTLETLPVGVWIVDQNGRILHGNQASQKIWAGARYVGMDQYGEYKAWKLATGKPVEPNEWGAVRAIQNGEITTEEELEIECFDGTRKIITNSAVPIYENNVIQGAIVVNRDITARKRIEQALAKNEALFKTVFQVLPVGAWITDEMGNIVFGNPAGQKIWAGAKYVGVEQFGEYKAWWLSTGQPVTPDDWAVARAIKNDETSLNEELEIECFDGTHKIILNSAIPVRDDQGRMYGVFVTNEDITLRKQAEQALIHSNELIEKAFNSIDILIAYMDRDFNFIKVNEAYAKTDQRPPEAFIGQNHFGLFPNEENQAIFESVVRSGQPFSIREKPFMFPDHPEYGVTYWDWSLQPVKGASGKVEGLVLSLLDVTESRQAKDKLREMALFPVFNPNAVLRVDAAGRIATPNPSAVQLGLCAGESLTAIIPDLRALDLPACIAAGTRHILQARLGERVLQWSAQGAPELGLAFLYGTDITRDKRSESILQTRLRLMQFSNTHSLDELLQFTLDEIAALTGSTIGFFHFLESDQLTLWLQAWSTNTLEKMCTAAGKNSHYNIEQAGVWADCVRQRRPILHNDYASLPNLKGLPEGHAPVIREVAVPIMRGEKIVAILGVGNKPQDYTTGDVELVATLSDFAWDVIERKKAEVTLRESDEQIKTLYAAELRARQLAETLREASQALSASLNSDTVFETLLDSLARVVPYDSAHIVLYDDKDHLFVRLARGEAGWQESERLLGKRFALDESSFIHPLLEERQILSYPDAHSIKGAEFFQSHARIGSWLGIPLLAGDQIIGVCGLEHTRPNFFTEEHLHWADTLTRQAAMAIHNAWLYEQVQQNRVRLQALSRRLVEVQELERHHIARELHDEAGQTLASVMVGLRMIERDSADPAAVIARCREVKQIADNVLENLHRLSVDLRPAALDHLGLVAALRQHAERVSDQHGLPIQFATVGKIERLPGEMETAIYRIVQEALTNVIRHAQAKRVDIVLERRDASLIVVIEDDGVGIDPAQPGVDQLGIVGMRERAEMLDGSITIESSPGKGTTVFLEVPCPFES